MCRLLCADCCALPQIIKNTDMVVGDVYLVNMGDKVVADGIMIDGFHLVIDEASLTGRLAGTAVLHWCEQQLLWLSCQCTTAVGILRFMQHACAARTVQLVIQNC